MENVRQLMKAYLFDLDGTLTDAREGLYLSFRAALQALGVADPGDHELERFLGAPLPEVFRVLEPGISATAIQMGMDAFRSAYEADGIMRNSFYSGVPEMLEAVVGKGSSVWVVTSKPQKYAVQVTHNLGLDEYVRGVIGAGLDETDTKGELVARTLVEAKVEGREAVMLGDRFYDIGGALENRVVPVGALWGYGSYEELHSAGCRRFVASADEFRTQFVEAGVSLLETPAPSSADA